MCIDEVVVQCDCLYDLFIVVGWFVVCLQVNFVWVFVGDCIVEFE